jgi:thymidylate synthase ThyX
MIEAKIITDSISQTGARLTTFQLIYPRMVHAELMTHRVFSRNASSSRAIPVSKIIQQVIDNPAMPVYWGKNQKGMQAKEELAGEALAQAKEIWLAARDAAVEQARKLVDIDLHKQIANRILEPWHHIHVVVTATDFDNFFNLRCDPDAQPEIKVLAEQMRDLFFDSKPAELAIGMWHLPYVSRSGGMYVPVGDKSIIKASVARCARVSYMTHDNENPTLSKDVELHDQLLKSVHMSPTEHQATPMIDPNAYSGNFRGWVQYRKMIKGECYTNYVK